MSVTKLFLKTFFTFSLHVIECASESNYIFNGTKCKRYSYFDDFVCQRLSVLCQQCIYFAQLSDNFNICAIVLKVDVISLQFAGGWWVVHWCYMLLMGICWHKPTEKTLHHCLAGVWDYVLHQNIALFVTNELHFHYCITLGHLRWILFQNIAAYLVLKIILRTCLELQTALGTVKWMTHSDKEHYHAYTLKKKK